MTAVPENMGMTPTGSAGRSPYSNQVGTVNPISGLLCREFGEGNLRETLLVMQAMPYTLSHATQGFGGLLLYTLPLGVIDWRGALGSFVATTSSNITSTLNSAKTVNWGLGTVINTVTTPIATTKIDLLPGYNITPPTFTSSTGSGTTITAAATTAQDYLRNLANTSGPPLLPLDGSATAIKVHLNMDVPTDADIDADATLSITGFFLLKWMSMGAYTAFGQATITYP